MRLKLLGLGAFAAAGALAAAAAGAATCYTVLDRSDSVIYRGTLPPIDLSDAGKAAREAMRRRGEHMVAAEADRCYGVEYFTGAAGSRTLTVDQVIDGLPTRSMPAVTRTSGAAAPARGAPATPAASSGRTRSSY
jgi:hypothetical protein